MCEEPTKLKNSFFLGLDKNNLIGVSELMTSEVMRGHCLWKYCYFQTIATVLMYMTDDPLALNTFLLSYGCTPLGGKRELDFVGFWVFLQFF